MKKIIALVALCSIVLVSGNAEAADRGNALSQIRTATKAARLANKRVAQLYRAMRPAVQLKALGILATLGDSDFDGMPDIIDSGRCQAAPAPQTTPGAMFTVDGNSIHQTIDCAGRIAVISGNDNHITLLGYCAEVHVSGNDQRIDVSGVGRLVVSGNDNIVWYKADASTRVFESGNDNQVVRTN